MFTKMKSLSPHIILTSFLMLFFITCSTKKQATKSMEATPVAAIPKQDNKTVIDSVPGETLTPTFRPHQVDNRAIKVITPQEDYNNAFDSLKNMLEGRSEPDFEKAVFLSENPYHNQVYDYATFQNAISANVAIIEKMIAANDRSDSIDFDTKVNEHGRFKLADIRYLPKEKKELYRKALSNWAIFKYITDTVFMYGTVFTYYHAPFAYATADPFGMKDWANSQVMNLLFADELKGNCFALTALYKILADRLHSDAKLCTAPQHIYVQHKDPKGQYYNVELATAGHPADGIIQTLTYTPTEAIMSGVALRDYNAKQSIGLCLVNLAKSYEHTFHTKDDAFLLRCAELVLAHDSLNLNALLLKQQVLDARVTQYAGKHKISSINQLKKDTAIAATLAKLEKHTALLYRLGYRQMPTQMQEMILNQYKSEPNSWNHQTKNPSPFTAIKVSDPKDQEYWTLTAGMYQEVFEPKPKETYGHFTLNTTTNRINAIDTHALKGFIIDPVAFAYDFGARMYDARIGRWLSVDPLTSSYPQLSPYHAFGNNPILIVDQEGEYNIVYLVVAKDKQGKPDMKIEKAQEIANKANEYFKKLGVETRVVVFDEAKSGTFNVENIDYTDNVAIVGESAENIATTMGNLVSPEFEHILRGTPFMDESLKSGTQPEKSNKRKDGWGNTLGIAVSTGVANDASRQGMKNVSEIEFAALLIVHGAGHNTTPINDFKGDVNKGHLNSGVMNDGESLKSIIQNEGINAVIDEKKSNQFYKSAMVQRYGAGEHKDNYSKNKANETDTPAYKKK